MEETISLKEIFDVLKKRLILIVSIVCAAAIIAAVVSYFVLTPIYAASTKFIVNEGSQDESSRNINDVRYNVELINTYNDIITSTAISEEVVQTLDLPMTPNQLAGRIEVSSSNDSQVVTVRVEDESPVTAASIANTTVEIFQDRLPDILNVDNVTVLTAAEVGENPSPIKPNKKLNVAIAIVLGGMIGVGIAFLLEYLDNTITTEEDIEKYLELPVLGKISTIENSDIRGQQFTQQNTNEKRGGSIE